MLIDDYKEPCVFMERVKEPDGDGGFYNVWRDGATFDAAIVLDDSILSYIAEKQGVTGVYYIYTDRAISLVFPDVIKRVSDGSTFRVAAEQDKTPISADLDISRVRAERWPLA